MTLDEATDVLKFWAWMRDRDIHPRTYQTPEQMRKDWERFRIYGDWRVPDPHKCGFWPYRPDGWKEKMR